MSQPNGYMLDLAQSGWRHPASDLAWAGSNPGDYSDAQWVRACVLDRGTGSNAKARYALPIRNPQGGLDKQGVASATNLIGHVKGASPAAISSAARALQRARSQVGLPPSDSLAKYAKTTS